MKKVVSFLCAAFIALASGISVSAGELILLNEVEVNPPVEVGDRCQYVEIKGTPNTNVPANIWFVAINSDSSNFGFLSAAIDLSGQPIGSNGILVIDNTNGGDCPNRAFDADASVMNYYHQLTLGKGSEGFYLVATDHQLVTGTDLDADDDGVIDLAAPLRLKRSGKSLNKTQRLGGGTFFNFVDGFNFIYNPEEQWAYGPGPNLVETFLGGVPDAATRFPENTTPNSAAAWYSGDLDEAKEESVDYTAPVSTNFPFGGKLTPGAPNADAQPNNAPFDFNGDGITDISVWRANPNALTFQPSNAAPEGSSSQWWILDSGSGINRAYEFGGPDDIPVPADYTGDGKTDVAFFRPATGEWFVLRSEDSSYYAFPFGQDGDIPAPGDYDNDGKADAGIFREAGSQWFILRSGDKGVTFFNFGSAGDKPTIDDFDGDGFDDIAIFRPSLGEWWQARSSEGVIAYEFGSPGDRTAFGRWTDDNRSDVAFYRPSTGEWYVLRSEDLSFYAFPFGAAGDIPVPGDYDGDGKIDQAVYRPSEGLWITFGSTSQQAQFIGFGVPTDVPIPSIVSVN